MTTKLKVLREATKLDRCLITVVREMDIPTRNIDTSKYGIQILLTKNCNILLIIYVCINILYL